MRAAPVRFLGAALWPLTIWASLSHLEEHPADDYVERTSPIVATAIGFWLAFGGLVAMSLFGSRVVEIVSDGDVARFWTRGPEVAIEVLWYIVPVLYVIGLWLFAIRDERYPR
jgi:hypothetical protein